MKKMCVLLLAAAAFAQETPQKVFRLDFVVKEMDESKVLSAKTFSVLAQNDAPAVIRSGSKVPYQVAPNSTQYADVGVNIDVSKLREANGQLIGRVVADISSVPTNPAGTQEGTMNLLPVIRHSRWESVVTIPLSKSTLLFSSDDLGSKRKTQMEVTATPVK